MTAKAPCLQEMGKHLMEIRSASVRFGAVSALSNVSLRVSAGDRLALIGGNGSGKSTLLRLLQGILIPCGGTVACVGVRRAMVFQRPFMLRASARRNVAVALWLAGASWRDARGQSQRVLESVGLGAVAQRPAMSLSGGQQQRLAVARALATNPQMLLLDEPTASLDPKSTLEVEELIGKFGSSQTAVAFSSHNLAQVQRLATRVIYLHEGVKVTDLPVEEFFSSSHLGYGVSLASFAKGELV